MRRTRVPRSRIPQHPQTDGIVVVRAIWNGLANLQEIEAAPSSDIAELVLRLYNPESRQWNLYRANSENGILSGPMVGEFTNGMAEFFDQEVFRGRTIFARNRFFDITPQSARSSRTSRPTAARPGRPTGS